MVVAHLALTRLFVQDFTERCPAGTGTNGANCPTPHITECATISCNSLVTSEDAGVSRGNKTYGYCHLFNAKMECPYKDCVHNMTLAPEADQAGGGGEGDEDMR